MECLLLCLGRRAILEQASCFDFSTNFRKFARRAQNAFGQSEHSSLTCHSIFVRQTPLPTSCRENALVRLCSWAKKTVTFFFNISAEHCDGQQRQKAIYSDGFMPSRPTTPISKKAQRSSCSDLDSEVTVLVPRQTEVSMSVWGKPSELGIPLLSTNQRTFIYTGPQPLSWRPSTIRSQVGPGSRLCEGDISSL